MKNYMEGYELILGSANDYQTLLNDVAIPILNEMKSDGSKIVMSLGCMTTGGVAYKKFKGNIDRKKMYDENIKVFVSIQNDIKRFLNGYSLFDQTIFEDAFVRIGAGKTDQDKLIKEFYWKLFDENLIDLFILQPYWYESDGTKKEVKKILTLKDANVLALHHDYQYYTDKYKKVLFNNPYKFTPLEIVKSQLLKHL